MRSILITGNQGYIGPVVARTLRARFPACRLVGVDAGYFASCTNAGHTALHHVGPREQNERISERIRSLDQVDEQWNRDIRDLQPGDLEGFDGIVHLAAISNDPMGKAFEAATYEINHHGAVHVARAAKAAGVPCFVFASSCSVYGQAGARGCTEDSALLPLTAYAIAKAKAEDDLARLADASFAVTSFRFATACGASPRVRLDLVLNDFVATALTAARIEILSDGTPWRPLIDVSDMAESMAWALARPRSETCLVMNMGRDDWNFQITDLAHAVSAASGHIPVTVNENAAPDKRSYTVSFRRSQDYKVLAGAGPGARTLARTVAELHACLREVRGLDSEFRQSDFIRLNVLSRLHQQGHVDAALRRTPGGKP